MSRKLLFVTAITIAIGTIFAIASRLRLSTLRPAELNRYHAAPPPPDDSCEVAERTIAKTSNETIKENTLPLSGEEMELYEAVLKQWSSGKHQMLNLSRKTVPFPARLPNCDCLKNVDIQNLQNASHSFHAFNRNVLYDGYTRLVDPKQQIAMIRKNDPEKGMASGLSVDEAVKRANDNGLFELSEIVFDEMHLHALVGYSFICGGLCGNGGVWLFEKKGGVWKKSEHPCGGWVS